MELDADADQVLIEKHGDGLTIRPRGWQECFASASLLDPSFPADIDDMAAESVREAP